MLAELAVKGPAKADRYERGYRFVAAILIQHLDLAQAVSEALNRNAHALGKARLEPNALELLRTPPSRTRRTEPAGDRLASALIAPGIPRYNHGIGHTGGFLMRSPFLCLLPLLAVSLARADEPKVIAKPDAFPTLVNPNCSHCVDEAKRRGRRAPRG